MNKRRAALMILVSAVVLVAGWYFGRRVILADQLRLLDSIRGVAAIIFGVVGAWIALIYPRALEEVLSRKVEASAHSDQIGRLVAVVVISIGVLALSLLLEVGFALRAWVDFDVVFKDDARGIGFGIVVLLMLLEIWALVLLLTPIDFLRAEVRTLASRKNYIKSLTRRAKFKKRDSSGE